MNISGTPAGRHMIRGAALGAAAGTVLACFTYRGASIDIGAIARGSYERLRARKHGTPRATNGGDG